MQALIFNGNDVIQITPKLLQYIFSENKTADLLFGTMVFLDEIQKPEVIINGQVNGKPIDAKAIYSVVRGVEILKERLAQMVGEERKNKIVEKINLSIKEENENT